MFRVVRYENVHRDNIKLETNKRYFVRRGASTVIHNLMRNVPGSVVRNVPGSVVYTTDPENDVKEITPPPTSRNMFEARIRLFSNTTAYIHQQANDAPNRRGKRGGSDDQGCVIPRYW